jgi:hypothetical protein
MIPETGMNVGSRLGMAWPAFFASMDDNDASNGKGFVFKTLRLLAGSPKGGTALH